MSELTSNRRRAWLRFVRNRSAWVGMLIVGILLVAAIGADWLAPYRANEQVSQFARPSWQHWLGTDVDQHDVFSRVIHGTRLSLVAGAISIAVAVLIGVPCGALAGFWGGRIDSLLMRAIDIALAFPSILLALLIATAVSRGWLAVIVAVGLINVPMFARQVRATVLGMRGLEYVLASRALGASTWHMLWRVILPGLSGPIVVLATLGLGSAILEVAGLSFLGVGGDPTDAEWGAMLAQSKDFLSRSVWPAIGPGAAISLAILGFNLLGDGLRDAIEPR
ncbi:MAG: ABC transporter permease [Planctomycetota bacterium]